MSSIDVESSVSCFLLDLVDGIESSSEARASNLFWSGVVRLNDMGLSQSLERRLAAGGPDADLFFFLWLFIAKKTGKVVVGRGGFKC